VRHPAALILEVDPLDREPLDAQQQRRAALHRLNLNDLNMRRQTKPVTSPSRP